MTSFRTVCVRRARSCATAVALLAALFTIGSHPIAGAEGPPRKSKLDRKLQDAKATGAASVRVIVRSAAGKTDVVADRLARRGKPKEKDLASIGAFVADVSGADLATLDRDPDVVGVSTDAVVQSFGGAAELAVAGDTLDEILALSEAHGTGDKVGIAVIDSGIARGRDLDGGRTDEFFDFTGGGNKAVDDYGHGTHVAGLIGGTGRQSKVKRPSRDARGNIKVVDVPFYAGVAPQARVLTFKVLDRNGAAYTSQVIEAIDYIVEHRKSLKIDIVNLSLGHPVLEPAATDPLVLAVESAVRAGLIVVAAAGNYGRNPETGDVGYGGITSPGNAPSAITVGAYDTKGTRSRVDDAIPTFSSRGPSWYDGFAKPDFVAPGAALVSPSAPGSTLFRLYPNRQVTDREGAPGYFRLSGTSMATAVTSGAIALMVQAARDAHRADPTPNAIKAILQYTALPMPGYDRLSQGAGSLNVPGAIELARSIDFTAPVGSDWLVAPMTGSTEIGGVSYQWGQAVIWGSAVIWGALDVNQPGWSQAVIWGSTAIWGHAVIWGSNVVWDQPGVWANAVIWGSTSIGVSDGSAVIWGSTEGLSAQSIQWGKRP